MRRIAAIVTSILSPMVVACSTGADSTREAGATEMFAQAAALLAEGNEANLRQAINVLNGCIEVAPADASCHAGLARVYVALGTNYNVLSPAEAGPASRQAAETALQLDANLGLAHLAMAEVLAAEWDWAAAGRAYQQAVTLMPADLDVLISYAWFLAGSGRVDSAREVVASITSVEPGFSDPHLAYMITGDAVSTLQAAESLIETEPTNPLGHWVRANIHAAEGNLEQAAEDLQNQIPLMNGDVTDEVALLGHLYARMGDVARANEMLGRLDGLVAEGRYVSPINRAWIHAGLGDVDQTISLVSEAVEAHAHRAGLGFSFFAYAFKPVDEDPRFGALLDSLELPGNR